MQYVIRIPVQVLVVDENGHANTAMASSMDIKVEAPTQAEAVEKAESAIRKLTMETYSGHPGAPI